MFVVCNCFPKYRCPVVVEPLVPATGGLDQGETLTRTLRRGKVFPFWNQSRGGAVQVFLKIFKLPT